MRLGAILVLASMAATAQTKVDLATQGKSVDFSAAGSTRPLKTGADLPASCAIGEMFFKTTAPEGANVFACTAANRWSVQAGNGAGGSVGVAADGTLVAVRPAINVVAGQGIATVFADTGYQVNVETAVDTAVMQTRSGAQSGAALLCAPRSGSGRSYACALSPTAGEYTTGMVLHWMPDVNGAGGATTLDIDTLGAVAVKMADGATDPSGSDIVAGMLYPIWRDGRVFRMPAASGQGGGITASTTPGAGAIPKADAGGKLVQGWIDFTGYQTTAGGFPWSQLTGTPSAFSPATHASRHATDGSDPVSATSIGAAPLGSPAFTGTPTAPTPSAGDNSTKLATTAYVDRGLSGKAASNADTTVNGQTCALGAACTIADSTKMPLKPNINPQTGTSYTLQSSDNGKIITFNSESAVTLTVPAGLGESFNCLIVQLGAGAVTPTGSGAALLNRQGLTKTAGQGAFASLMAYAADAFLMAGDLQ